MDDLLEQRLRLLESAPGISMYHASLRGIEREALRIDASGRLATTPHPQALGSTLTHPHITTDFSESMLELVSSPWSDSADLLEQLDAIHRFVHQQIRDESLWNHSMPCRLPPDDAIPIAVYGSSSEGMLKHVYRKGLALRYGRAMQCIAGVHYNFSLDERLLHSLHDLSTGHGTDRHRRSEAYMGMTRNLDRYRWLVAYLFGASPACDSHFISAASGNVAAMSGDTVYLPYGTSLRMSKLGYQNSAQDDIIESYNSLDAYLRGLERALSMVHAPYAALDESVGGVPSQLNANLLQIENEHYASIRPKRVVKQGQTLCDALRKDGIKYLELRFIDIDPFASTGIALSTLRFLDVFAWFCMLEESPPSDKLDMQRNQDNFSLAATEGRRPGLALSKAEGDCLLQTWGLEIIERMVPVAEALDRASKEPVFSAVLAEQRTKLHDPGLTPSARILDAIKKENNSFIQFAETTSKRISAQFRSRPLESNERQEFDTMARASLDRQSEMENKK